jgi:hypothetical protein
MRIPRLLVALFVLAVAHLAAQTSKPTSLCLDGLCIGESINDPHFAEVNWIVPDKQLTKESCVRIACKPEVAFRGYPSETQKQLSDALSWVREHLLLQCRHEGRHRRASAIQVRMQRE